MEGQVILFYVLAGFILAFGAMSVFSRHIFRAAVYLLLSLIGVAGLYVMMDMNFVAALQIMIYVGGIVVLIIFSIFLTHNTGKKLPLPIKRRLIWSFTIPFIGFVTILWVFLQHPFAHEYVTKSLSLDVGEIGHQLFNINEYGYVFPFEMISILLLAALIGSIVIAQSNTKDKK